MTVFSIPLALIISFITFRVINASAVRRLEAAVRAKGEPLTTREMAANEPEIPDEVNAAVPLLELWEAEQPDLWRAFREGQRSLPPKVAPIYDPHLPLLGKDQRKFSRTNEVSVESRRALETFLTERAGYQQSLREALRRPKARFPVRLENAYDAAIPHVGRLKTEAQHLRLQAIYANAVNDVPKALAAIEEICLIGQLLKDEPILISQLVRIACYSMAVSEAERLLQHQSVEAEHLNRLAAILDIAKPDDGLNRALVMERASQMSVLSMTPEMLRVMSRPDADSSDPIERANGFASGMGLLSVLGLLDLDRRLMLETMGHAIESASDDTPAALQEFKDTFAAAERKASGFPPRLFSRMLLPALGRMADRFAQGEALRRCALVAICIERFRRENHGRLPANMEQLIPSYSESIPSDPFDGRPLRFRRLVRGYVVYSIGPDRRDQEGLENPAKERGASKDVTFTIER